VLRLAQARTRYACSYKGLYSGGLGINRLKPPILFFA
jgi:hypothetical protein